MDEYIFVLKYCNNNIRMSTGVNDPLIEMVTGDIEKILNRSDEVLENKIANKVYVYVFKNGTQIMDFTFNYNETKYKIEKRVFNEWLKEENIS